MRFSELDGKAVGVWGLGRETRSFLTQLGRRLPNARVTALVGDAPLPPDEARRLAPGARIAGGDGIEAALAGCDVVVRSPGVSIYGPVATRLREAGVALTTATALWMAEDPARPTIGISGTKGKSTTALLTAHLARSLGLQVELAGNVGRPALDLLDGPGADLYVIELSSYQLADLTQGPRVALLTNLYPEHLPWHGTFERYRDDKLRLATLPGPRAVVAPGRDAGLADLDARVRDVPVRRFGVPGGYDLTPQGVVDGDRLVLDERDLPLPGEHNALNLCAALEAIRAFGLPEPAMPDAIRGLQPLPHRLEDLGTADGLRWINDSISTTPESTLAGLASFPGAPIVLVAGGLDRGQDYAELGRTLAARDAHLIALPDTGPEIAAAAAAAGLAASRIHETGTVEQAVRVAREAGARGATVLLSPAGASQPHFVDFEARGEAFRTAVGATDRSGASA